MTKDEILAFPSFPEFIVDEEEGKITYTSNVYIHFEKEKSVWVYAYPIVTSYIVKGNISRQLFLNEHLKSCLVNSKYLIALPELVETLPLVEILFKQDKHFLNLIHTKYF